MNKTTEALKIDEAIATLELVLNDGADHGNWPLNKNCEDGLKCLVVIREALAEPVKQEPVAWGEVVLREGDVTVSGYLYGQLPVGTKLYTTPPTAPNLNCKSVQRRLATSWGYVRKEEYDMAKVATARAIRDAAVAFAAQYAQAAEDAYEQSGSRFDDGEANAARGIEQAIAALPIEGEEK